MSRPAWSARPLWLPLRWLFVLVRALAGPPARALRGGARVVGDPARQMVDYWLSERATLRQGFVANTISAFASLLAGIVLINMQGRMESIPGLLILIPVSIGMRGDILGAMAARLGTLVHTGLFEVSRDRNGPLYQNVYAAALLTVVTAVIMGLLARAIAGLVGLETVSAWDLVVVAVVGGVLSSAVLLALAVPIAILSFRRGWDLDSVGTVLITAMGDVVTLPCLLVASYLVGRGIVTPLLGALSLAAAIGALWAGWTERRATTRRVIQESLPVLCVATVLDILAGTVAEPRLESLVAFGAFLILLPGFLGRTGALGSMLAARLGSKLHLGAITPAARPQGLALLDGSIVFVQGLLMYLLTGAISLATAVALGRAYPGVLRFMGVTMFGGILATLVASLIGYYAAVMSYRFGLDPDNHTIPIVNSGMDLVGMICLVVALSVFGVA